MSIHGTKATREGRNLVRTVCAPSGDICKRRQRGETSFSFHRLLEEDDGDADIVWNKQTSVDKSGYNNGYVPKF